MNILTALKDLTDSRREQAKKYELSEIIFATILGMLCNANSYRDVATFIEINFLLLKNSKVLSCKKPPVYSTIRNIFLVVDKKALAKLVQTYQLEIINFTEGMHFSMDGKSMRGSYDRKKNISAAHIMSVFETNLGISIDFENVRDKKTNEIPIAQQIISTIPVKGAIFSLDALHCQKKTVKICLETGNDLLVQVKKNQKAILKTCQLRAQIANNFETFRTFEKNHGRKELRDVTVYDGIPKYVNNWSKKFAIVIKAERFREDCISEKASFEESYYLCTKKLTAEEASKLVRDHWAIENRQNYVLDETFGEDASRIRIKPEIFSLLRIIALNILRLNKVKNIRNARKRLAYDVKSVFDLKYL